MPRRGRVFVEGLIYHVYNRVGRGEAPFKLDDEAERFWALLHEVKTRDGLSVYAWCVMPNHYHLAVRTDAVPLWRSIRFVQHRYTQGFNRRCKVFGPLWQSRYKARPVVEQDSLLRLLAYIHLNPVAAKMVKDPGAYRWSGHRELTGHLRRSLLDVDLVLGLFGGTRREALHAYRGLLRQEREAAWFGAGPESVAWWGEEPVEAGFRRRLDALGGSAAPMRRRASPEEFLKQVSALLGVSVGELASVQRDSRVVEARELVGGLAIERWGVGVKALADVLGKSRDGVSLWVRRAARRRSEDGRFAQKLDKLDRRLAAAFKK
jgi:putative transposase